MPRPQPQWRCPRCGHRFVTRNLSHSCGRYILADHFRDRAPIVRQLFDRWRALARACGPVTVYAQKTRIVFQGRVRFGGAVAHPDWLEGTLWLCRRVDHRCLHKMESFGRLGYGAHFRLTQLTDIDSDLEGLMREAYVEHAQTPARRRIARQDSPSGVGIQDCAHDGRPQGSPLRPSELNRDS